MKNTPNLIKSRLDTSQGKMSEDAKRKKDYEQNFTFSVGYYQ